MKVETIEEQLWYYQQAEYELERAIWRYQSRKTKGNAESIQGWHERLEACWCLLNHTLDAIYNHLNNTILEA